MLETLEISSAQIPFDSSKWRTSKNTFNMLWRVHGTTSIKGLRRPIAQPYLKCNLNGCGDSWKILMSIVADMKLNNCCAVDSKSFRSDTFDKVQWLSTSIKWASERALGHYPELNTVSAVTLKKIIQFVLLSFNNTNLQKAHQKVFVKIFCFVSVPIIS